MNKHLLRDLRNDFKAHFGVEPAAIAYAPGRVEILGNHTDYNEGYVLSAAINFGTFFAAAPAVGQDCRLVADDIKEECRFSVADPAPNRVQGWANYVKGMLGGLKNRGSVANGFMGMFLGDVPLGAGLSSSAALEMSSGLALAAVFGMRLEPLELARMGQRAEHEYAGVKCGLLDQISSLYGREDELVVSDFRTLRVETARLGSGARFLICNTAVKHSLVDSEYNERRSRCEEAARYFARVLSHPVQALRDVSWEEWERHQDGLNPVTARRAAHVIGENTRVLTGGELLARHDLRAFGTLMFESHESSRTRFENSCPELDFLVNTARSIPEVLGARLSGGGFGGSAVVLVKASDAESVASRLANAYQGAHGHPCATMTIRPSPGASLLAAGAGIS